MEGHHEKCFCLCNCRLAFWEITLPADKTAIAVATRADGIHNEHKIVAQMGSNLTFFFVFRWSSSAQHRMNHHHEEILALSVLKEAKPWHRVPAKLVYFLIVTALFTAVHGTPTNTF